MATIFVGTHKNRLDAKGRVSVPAPFRQALGGKGNERLVCFPSQSQPALEAVSELFLLRLSEGVDTNYNLFSEENDALNLSLLGEAEHLRWDEGGRIQIPKNLLEHADLQEEVLFIGLVKRFQLWNPAAYRKQLQTSRQLVKDKRLDVSFRTAGLNAPIAERGS